VNGESANKNELASDHDDKSVSRPLDSTALGAHAVNASERAASSMLALPSFSCGGPLPGIDLDRALQLDATLDTEHIRLKLLTDR
jgi:hypothetical protein